MERRINLNEFFELMGGQHEAEKFFDKVIEDNISKDVKGDSNQIVSVVHSKVEQRNRKDLTITKQFTISTMLIIERMKIDAKFLKEHTEDFESISEDLGISEEEPTIYDAFEVSPILFYVCDIDIEMPDCVLDMMNLSKRIKARRDDGTFTDEWLVSEIKKMPEINE